MKSGSDCLGDIKGALSLCSLTETFFQLPLSRQSPTGAQCSHNTSTVASFGRLFHSLMLKRFPLVRPDNKWMAQRPINLRCEKLIISRHVSCLKVALKSD